MNHTDRTHRETRHRLSKDRRDAIWNDDRSDDLLPWADPYITSLFDEHRRESPWKESFARSREEKMENHPYWNACR